MQLVEQGKVALTDPVAKYIPEFAKLGVFVAGGGNEPFVTRPPATPMRIVDLMRHTSGLTYSFQERSMSMRLTARPMLKAGPRAHRKASSTAGANSA